MWSPSTAEAQQQGVYISYNQAFKQVGAVRAYSHCIQVDALTTGCLAMYTQKKNSSYVM
jgi:hypothetical protein